ncbi:MAG: hypothetical protein QOJ79_3401 [Actinomycetota bacterium]|jgi:hypothetical protein|nr:hypothetical protein [Actinomycetota bacterium]
MSAEDRVAAALRALAEQTQAPIDGEHRLQDRLRREHRYRRAAAVMGSAAVVAGVALAVGNLGPSGTAMAPTPAPFASAASTPDPMASDLARLASEKAAAESSPSPSPAPTYPPPAADVAGPSTVITVESDGRYAFRDARRGTLLATGGSAGYRATAVTVAADGRTFYVAETKGTCGDWRVQRIRVSRTSRGVSGIGSDVQGVGGTTGEISSMAVTSDGNKLAYALAGVDPESRECTLFTLRVMNLSRASTRSWTGGAMLSALNWAPDGRTLLMHGQGCCGDYQPGVSRLDTGASGTTFDAAREVPGTGDAGSIGDGWVVSSTASSANEVFAAQESFGDPGAVRIVVLDPVSGRVRRTIADVIGVDTADALCVTNDGRHVLLSTGYDDYRIDDGRISHLGSSHDLRPIAW